MADIVPSLFGLTPEMYQQRQSAQADQMALQYAQLTPMQQAQFAIGRGAYGLAGALGGALGGQDPQLQMISTRNAIARQIDYNNPESIMQGVNALTQAGDTTGAMQLADVARRMESEMAQRTQRLAAAQASLAQANRERVQTTPAEIAKAARVGELTTLLQNPDLDAPTRANLEAQLATLRPEKAAATEPAQLQLASAIEGAQAAVDALQNQPASPERDAALRRAVTRLTALERQLPQQPKDEKLPSVGGDREAVALELYNTTFASLTPDQRAAVNKRVEAEQGRKAAAAAPQVKVEMKQQESFAVGRGRSQSDLLAEATASARGASQALSTINSMKQLNDTGQLFTGPMANPAVGASNLLASVGLLSPDQVLRLSKSEVYDKQAKDLVMQDLGGKLGAQISDADRKYVEARIPQLTTSVKARTELLNKLDEIQRGKISFYQKMNAHANQFGNLNTFDFAQTYAPVASSSGWSIKKKEPAK
jgi:hypothetical protein